MKFFKKKLNTKTSADKDFELLLQKFDLRDTNLTKGEVDLYNIISGLVIIPLFQNKEDINNNTIVRLFSFFYLLGVIDGFCQSLNHPNSSFYKICIHFFLFDSKKNGYNYNQFAEFFLERYNQIIEFDLVKEIIKLGGEDVFSELNSIARNEKRLIPQIRLDNLINEWRELKFQSLTSKQKELLDYLNS